MAIWRELDWCRLCVILLCFSMGHILLSEWGFERVVQQGNLIGAGCMANWTIWAYSSLRTWRKPVAVGSRWIPANVFDILPGSSAHFFHSCAKTGCHVNVGSSWHQTISAPETITKNKIPGKKKHVSSKTRIEILALKKNKKKKNRTSCSCKSCSNKDKHFLLVMQDSTSRRATSLV